MVRSLVARAVALLFCSFLLLASAHAQYRASIQGTVTDPSGAVVPDATVTLTNQETGQALTANTNAAGVYNFNALPPSTYTIKVEKSGFKQKVLESVQVIAEQANAVNVALEVGQMSENVTVTDASPIIDTETANASGTVTSLEYQKMPSINRDPFQLLQLAPGAFGDGSQNYNFGGGTNSLPGSSMAGSGGADGVFKIENGGQISVGGARTGDNNYTIDGVGTTSVTWGGASVITPNEDSIKEVKIVTDNYDAEYGRYRGGQVEIISKNGTNDYHGSFFFKAHRPGLDAFTPYNGYNSDQPGCIDDKAHGYCGNVRSEDRFNDWGGSIGGPIIHNRLFGFFAYETIADNTASATTSGWYETSAFRALAAPGTNAAAFLTYPGVAPLGGHQIDQNCASIGLKEGVNCITIPGQGLNLGTPLTTGLGTQDTGGLYSAFSPGTGGDGKGGANNLDPTTADIQFLQGVPNPGNSTHRQYNARVDFQATSKDLLAASMYYVPNSSTGINGYGYRQMNNFNSTYKNRAATFLWDHTFSSSMVNEARANAAGWEEKDLAQNPNAPWGLPQVGVLAIGTIPTTNGNPNDFAGWGIGSFNGFDQWTYAAKDVLTKIHGAHTMKMGGEYTRLLSVDAPFWSDRPGYQFNNIWDFLNDAPVTENAQFDPQTGVPSALRKDLRSDVIGFFFQDNYKVKSNLTITAGLRWEYFGPVSEIKGKLGNVEFGSGANMFTGMHIRTGGNEFNAQKTNFGPQLGFAWSPRSFIGHDFSDRLVIRGGYGIAYNGVAQSNTLDTRFNPPFVDNGQAFSASAGNLTYINTFPSNVHNPNGYAPNPNAIVTFPPNNLPAPGSAPISLTAFAQNEPTTYTMHYSVNGEYDLGHKWMASAGYQGSQTRHLTDHYNLYNPASVAGIMFNPVVAGITFYGNDGNASFNALLLELKHNFSQSFQLDTQYRLSHTLDPGSNAYAGGFYQWNVNQISSYGNADYDARHMFKVFGVWSPTIFRGSHSWAEKIAGGWSLSGILNWHTGFPWTPQYPLNELDGGLDPVYNFGPGGQGSSSNSGSGSLLPAGYNGGLHTSARSSAVYDATSFFTAPTVVPGTNFFCLFPNPPVATCPSGQQGLGPLPTPGMERNAFYGPRYLDLDAALVKSFGLPKMPVLGENAKIQFRANFYNLFNTLNLTNLQTDIALGSTGGHLGEAQQALGARVIEMEARFDF